MGPNLAARTKLIRARLNGTIALVLGNHDRSANFYSTQGFDRVCRIHEEVVDGFRIRMRHKPPTDEERQAGGYDFFLHGHVHEKYARLGNEINVGVDVREFTPKTLEQLLL